MHIFCRQDQYKKRVSAFMLAVMAAQLVYPNVSLALSSGPVQPEIMSFEPVGTTDMVDMFTGDFVYNIPLMDVEGYPVNISYHGGVSMDQEASWVGLGWNINPGAVNRSVRGLPDEFRGELIEKEINIKPEITKKIGLDGVSESVGLGQPILNANLSLGGYVNMSNYRGVSVDFTSAISVNTKLLFVGAGFNVGASVGSQAGASVNYSRSLGVGISQAMGKGMNVGGGFNLNKSGVYSPRTGLKESVGFSANLSVSGNMGSASISTGTSVPIGMMNHTAAITNPYYMDMRAGQVKGGLEAFWIFPSLKCGGSVTTIAFDADGSRKGYGYYNLSGAEDNDLTDFSREKDGMYNTTMQLLPQTHLTYDVYSVNGQGTGGSFRPFRNDIGSVYDPYTKSQSKSDEKTVEAGGGNLFSLGGEDASSKTLCESGPWKETDAYRNFQPKRGGTYEDIYFKEAGELTANNEVYLNTYANNEPIKPEQVKSLPAYRVGSDNRITRSNHIYTVSGDDEDSVLIMDGKALVSYTDTFGFKNYPSVGKEIIPRVDPDTSKALRRKKNHVTEIIQNQKDGRRYVYGLPVMNNIQREVVFAVDPKNAENTVDDSRYLVTYVQGSDDSKNNRKGLDWYYSSTVTPSYVTAHLLTSVLSADYIDVTGNGISDDDLGTYTKFNYSRKSTDYRWRAPIRSGKAQYMPGYKTDERDDKASYMIGSREQWMLHSIETKNYVAEFYVSKRLDAQGVLDKITNGSLPGSYTQYNNTLSSGTSDNKSYKLDSIVLYNKHDRFINNAGAAPIKTVIFGYDYSLCKNVPNGEPGMGKLTLKKIQTRYGRSNLNMTAAYNFKYSDLNPDYDEGTKDRWGMYKPNDDGQLNNFEFPFTRQSPQTNDYAGAWTLTEIGLPSGGVIKAEFEADDYAYVQNKEAMEMFRIAGFGSSVEYRPTDKLYNTSYSPNLYIYFKRRKDAENPALTARENYLKGTNILYYNVATELAAQRFEPIKGYAEVTDVRYCENNSDYGYVKVLHHTLESSSDIVNPITYTALNTGRYSLPHIFFPGSDPESSDLDNIVQGLKASIKELFQITSNPLSNMLGDSKAQRADFTRSFIRLTSPGLAKKGGGHRVKAVLFYDSWDAMASGQLAVYGKKYTYTLKRDDGKGVISSGVASYEPLMGGDELPQRIPVGYIAQEASRLKKLLPNDPVELFQEMPIGESFYPGPVVGYSNVSVTSIHKDVGRSSQTEDVYGFYTARDFPIQAVASPINSPKPVKKISLTDAKIEQESSQGFAFVFNDMHGKPRNTEHWVLKPVDTVRGRELISMQKYDYLTEGGRLSNMVPVFQYNGYAGKISVGSQKMGLETDITLDTRMRKEVTNLRSFSGNLNTSLVGWFPVPIPLGYPFSFENDIQFRAATVSKVTQQYGILSKVTSSNEGTVTEVRNEVFDINSGNVLVTSVNNEFKEREYTVSYPAYWAYKELGPCFQNHDVKGRFKRPLYIDSLGSYSERFVNYNPAFSSSYTLPSNMPVARVEVDEDLPNYKLGDELLLSSVLWPGQMKVWMMGYTSDLEHCYIVLAPREPFKMDAIWLMHGYYNDVNYRVVKSGMKNRLGETIQTYTTSDRSNIFPYLKDSLTNIISLSAQTYKYNLNQVYAANTVSDSLNPFITGKVGQYRPEQQLINLKNRDYSGTARNAGTYTTPSYWKTELDKFSNYCPDSIACPDCPVECPNILDSFSVTYMGVDAYGNDSFKVKFSPHPNASCMAPNFNLQGYSPTYAWPPGYFKPKYDLWGPTFAFSGNATDSFSFIYPNRGFTMYYKNGCCKTTYHIFYDGTKFHLSNEFYSASSGSSTPAIMYNTYRFSPSLHFMTVVGYHVPFRIRQKIFLGMVGHYDGSDNEQWIKTQQVTKYNWFGQELENKEEGIGYNSAVYGYNQQLPVCVSRNAKHSEVLYESFEDYNLLRPVPDKNKSYMPLVYSPFQYAFATKVALGPVYEKDHTHAATFNGDLTKDDAHTGNYSLKVGYPSGILLNGTDAGMAEGYSFSIKPFPARKYVVSLWVKPVGAVTDARTAYALPGLEISRDTVKDWAPPSGAAVGTALIAKSDIIDGWQKFEALFDATVPFKTYKLNLPSGYYYDDIRVFPFESNSKGFVYDPVTRKLMATLDENNFATFYEYDAEGNLVRTKKETEKGILTITESRSTNRKN